MTTFRINEIFYSIQGEGYWTGRPAVFVRFSGCNLWSGHEADRASALCTFCDTKFVDSTEYKPDDLLNAIDSLWPGDEHKMVVLTGGEPALQLRNEKWLFQALQARGFYIAVETNGTIPFVWGELLDWVCVSPKTRKLQNRKADELKLVYPQTQLEPEMFSHYNAEHFWLSPMDGPALKQNTAAALDYVQAHPQWRLNIQTHKVIGAR
jgi:7-carboxy-7-deazaguanine synthase (Cx14CxxC type)